MTAPHLHTSAVLHEGTDYCPEAHRSTFDPTRAIAAVRLGSGLTIQCSEPGPLLELADALKAAAGMLGELLAEGGEAE